MIDLESWIKILAAHPFLFILFPILFLYSNNIHLLTFEGIILPTIGLLSFGFILWIILRFVLKSGRKSAILVSLYAVLFFSYGHIFHLLSENAMESFEIRHEYFLIPFLALVVSGTYYIVKSTRRFDNATTILNVIGIVLVVMVFGNILSYSLAHNYIEDDVEVVNLQAEMNVENPPDIYYLIFDAYPNHNVLSKFFEYNNDEFITDLTERGFYVVPESHSNYVQSFLSISSSLNMKHMTDLTNVLGIDSKDQQLTYKMLNNNVVMLNLKNMGYKIISFDSGYWGTSAIEIADENLCTKTLNVDSTFLSYLKRTTIVDAFESFYWDDVQDFRADDQREKILCQFSEMVKIKDRIQEPIFVFNHFMSPHGPYVFGPNGESVSYVELDELQMNPQERKKAFTDQITFLNKNIKEVIDKLILESERPPIIIIQSDHGIDVKAWGLTNDERHQYERNANLSAYYLPDNKHELIYDTITPVNSFRLIFNAYFDSNYSFVDDTMYSSLENQPYNFTDVTDILTGR